MPKKYGPPIILPEQIKALNILLIHRRLPHYALYFELLAYPRMSGKSLRKMTKAHVDTEAGTILKIPVLPATMQRVIEYIKRTDVEGRKRLFKFTRQRAHNVWSEVRDRTGMSQKANMTDLKIAFKEYLIRHYPDYNKERK